MTYKPKPTKLMQHVVEQARRGVFLEPSACRDITTLKVMFEHAEETGMARRRGMMATSGPRRGRVFLHNVHGDGQAQTNSQVAIPTRDINRVIALLTALRAMVEDDTLGPLGRLATLNEINAKMLATYAETLP